MAEARYPSGKGEVCKTFIRGFDSHPRLHQILYKIRACGILTLLCTRPVPRFPALADRFSTLSASRLRAAPAATWPTGYNAFPLFARTDGPIEHTLFQSGRQPEGELNGKSIAKAMRVSVGNLRKFKEPL